MRGLVLTTRPGRTRTPAHAAPAPAALNSRQRERRGRILRATAELAAEGGFDAVQMRAVAESSQVALGTLYRYFPSKVHLLVAVMQDRLETLHGTLRSRPPGSAEPGTRVARTLMRAFRALRDEPQLADAMVRALTFADRSVREEVDTVIRLTTAIIVDAMRLSGAPTPAQSSVVRVITHTWLSALIAWLSGRATLAQVEEDVGTVCTLADTVAAPDGPGCGAGAVGAERTPEAAGERGQR
ncbi:TetR family transcriptional regulator [Streptomyces sp. NPDC059740]|uniref:TetR family transcriptional regulator n=1 Tax=Streptomyces sp. NPDC059740 TaxID=3346926 RepID=UPI0036637DB8